MATTTNYGWETPDDTDLVKDGAAAIRTLGSSIDTTTKNLNPSTTLGDIEYRSSTANTNTRLAIGSSGQVLTVSSGVPAWATPVSGSLTLLSTTSMSGVNSVTISSISQSYRGLAIWGDDIQSADNNIDMRVNGSSSSIYKTLGLGSNDISVGALATSLAQIVQLQTSTQSGFFRMLCWGYTETASQKIIVNNAHGRNAGGAGAVYNQANYINVGAINSVTFFTADTGANFTQGTIRIYGVN